MGDSKDRERFDFTPRVDGLRQIGRLGLIVSEISDLDSDHKVALAQPRSTDAPVMAMAKVMVVFLASQFVVMHS